jgi:hypothetical protein
MTMHARTTLINLDVEELTPEQIVSHGCKPSNKIHVGNDDEDNSGTRVSSFIVDNMCSGNHPGGDC